MFTEGVAARQLGCALANTRSLSVSALGTVCHLLEAERGNPRILLLISARYPHYFPPSFYQQGFLPPDRPPSFFARSFRRTIPLPFSRLFRFMHRPCANIKHDRDDGSSRGLVALRKRWRVQEDDEIDAGRLVSIA